MSVVVVVIVVVIVAVTVVVVVIVTVTVCVCVCAVSCGVMLKRQTNLNDDVQILVKHVLMRRSHVARVT